MYTRVQTLRIELEEASGDLAASSRLARTDRSSTTLWACHMQTMSALDWFKLGAAGQANENLDRVRALLIPLGTRASRRALARLEAIGRL